jgi:hypothetical protein
MMRNIRVRTLFLIIMTIWSRPAKADLWDWLADLSGPGEFDTRGNLTTTVYCRHEDQSSPRFAEGMTGDTRGGNARFFHLLQDRHSHGPCMFVDARRLNAKQNAKYFPVGVQIYETGPTVRVWGPFEAGVGAGAIHFHSRSVTTTRAIVDIPRLTVKPLFLIPSLQKHRNGGFAFLQYSFNLSFILGRLDHNDFQPLPGTTFNTRNDLVISRSFMLDPVALVRLLANR